MFIIGRRSGREGRFRSSAATIAPSRPHIHAAPGRNTLYRLPSSIAVSDALLRRSSTGSSSASGFSSTFSMPISSARARIVGDSSPVMSSTGMSAPSVAQPGGKFQPCHHRHVLVEDQTGRPRRVILEERRCRSIGANCVACVFEQEFQRIQNRCVIVHYRHDSMVIVCHRLRLQGEFDDNTMLPRTRPVVPISQVFRGAQ